MDVNNDTLKLTWISVDKLKPYAKNARKHTADDVQYIANSIKQFGFNDPIGVWGKENIIVEGHGRLEAAKMLGMDSVPIIHLDHMTDEQRRAYALAHNKTAEMSAWDDSLVDQEIHDIIDIDMSDFGFDIKLDLDNEDTDDDWYAPADDLRDPSCQHNVFENQELRQFPITNKYGIPEMIATQTVGNQMLRFMDWKEIDDPENYIAHFYYDDYKFIKAWREPNYYVDRLRAFKAIVSPDFSLYIDFPLALQILSCYRRQWCGAYWQSLGLDVIPDVVWGEKESFDFCFEGIPKHSTVAVSTVGVKNDPAWNNGTSQLFKDGYDEMLNRLEPTTILFYGDMIEGLDGNIIRIPSYYEQKRKILNANMKK